MDPGQINITELIPQRSPMQMIDKLVAVGEKSAKGSLYINNENLFVENGFLSESGLIEFIAQTAAAYTGYNNLINQSTVREGYIGALKNLQIYELPLQDSVITSEIEIVNEIVGFTIITGKVFLGDNLLVECEMRILEGR